MEVRAIGEYAHVQRQRLSSPTTVNMTLQIEIIYTNN